MKKTLLLVILFMVALGTAAAQQGGREAYDLFGGEAWVKEGDLNVRHDGLGLVFSGTAGRGGAGYVVESRNLGLERKQRFILVVSGITDADKFDFGKLLKLELNGNAAIVTSGREGMNRNDPNYLNARNVEYVFDISNIRNIRKINLVFYNCSIGSVEIKVFTE